MVSSGRPRWTIGYSDPPPLVPGMKGAKLDTLWPPAGILCQAARGSRSKSPAPHPPPPAKPRRRVIAT